MNKYLLPEDDGLSVRSSGIWALEKLDYLERYINIFETAMREKFSRNYIDLLAGPGKNRIRKTGEVRLGSPLLALTTPHPFTGYYFVDMERAATQALIQRCSVWDFSSRVNIYTDDCNIVVDEIVEILKRNEQRSLNLAFLDPEGLELQWNTVAKLATVQRMDLIINYPQGGLNRSMSNLIDAPGQTGVDRFFGEIEWRRIYRAWQGKQTTLLHRQLMDFYKEKLHDLGYKEVLRDDETGDEPLMRNAKKNAPLYRLLFASKHALGHNFWQKITRRDVHGQYRLI